MKEKLHIFFKPFVIILLSLTIAYTFLNWLLIVEWKLFSPRETITSFFIPAALTGLCTWFFLRPKIKTLVFKGKYGDWRGFYSGIAWITLTIPLIIAQEYVSTETGKLTKLDSIKDIHTVSPTKYYAIDRYYIDKESRSVHSIFNVSGRTGADFAMHIYIVSPIFINRINASRKEPIGWLGVEYVKVISNYSENDEKEFQYNRFEKDSQIDFDYKNVSDFVYFERITKTKGRDGFEEAIMQNQSYKEDEVVLIGVNEPFEWRNGNKVEWFFGSLLIGCLVWLIMLMIPKIDPNK